MAPQIAPHNNAPLFVPLFLPPLRYGQPLPGEPSFSAAAVTPCHGIDAKSLHKILLAMTINIDFNVDVDVDDNDDDEDVGIL